MKKFTLLLMALLCLFSKALQAQSSSDYITYPDTINVNLSETDKMMIVMNSFEKLEQLSSLNGIIKTINDNLEHTDYDEPVDIVYNRKDGKSTIEIEPSENSEVKITAEGKTIIRTVTTVSINAPEYVTKITVSNPEDLRKLENADFQQLAKGIRSSLKHYFNPNRERLSADVKYTGNLFSNIDTRLSRSLDQLELSVGIGAGLVRDKFVPEISGKISFNLQNKYNVHTTKFGFIYSQHYFFQQRENNNYDMDVNDFLTVFIGENLSKQGGPARWMSLGVGYLIRSNGGYFKGNTFKLSAEFQSSKSNIDIIPELIVTDNFRRVFPGIRLGLTF